MISRLLPVTVILEHVRPTPDILPVDDILAPLIALIDDILEPLIAPARVIAALTPVPVPTEIPIPVVDRVVHVRPPLCVVNAVLVDPLYSGIPLAPFATREVPIIFPELSIVALVLTNWSEAATATLVLLIP